MPVLQTVRGYASQTGNRCENVGWATLCSWLTALQLLIPCYFFRHSYYVLRLDRVVALPAYVLLLAELTLCVVACLRFADVRTQLTFVFLAMIPSIGIMALSIVLVATP